MGNTLNRHGGWGPWGTCSTTCGNGTQTRLCNTPLPAGSGLQCTDPANPVTGGGSATQVCNVAPCPVNGGWGQYGACDVSCGGGTQTRTCTNPAPANSGLACTDPLNTSVTSNSANQNCNTLECPIPPPVPAPTPVVIPTPAQQALVVSNDTSSDGGAVMGIVVALVAFMGLMYFFWRNYKQLVVTKSTLAEIRRASLSYSQGGTGVKRIEIDDDGNDVITTGDAKYRRSSVSGTKSNTFSSTPQHEMGGRNSSVSRQGSLSGVRPLDTNEITNELRRVSMVLEQRRQSQAALGLDVYGNPTNIAMNVVEQLQQSYIQQPQQAYMQQPQQVYQQQQVNQSHQVNQSQQAYQQQQQQVYQYGQTAVYQPHPQPPPVQPAPPPLDPDNMTADEIAAQFRDRMAANKVRKQSMVLPGGLTNLQQSQVPSYY